MATRNPDAERAIGRRIRWWRRNRGITQHTLAEACGVRFQQVQKWEGGLNRVSATQLWAVALALEVPVAELFPSQEAPAHAA
jgi:transcriptional regulator with XRE-family HTH domain